MAIKGLNKVLNKLNNLGDKGRIAIEDTTQSNAQELAAKAKIAAPKNDGEIAKQINVQELTPLAWMVAANAPYSGYVEFGTGTHVSVPKDLENVARAIQNNDTSGTFKQGLESIKDWCRKKGIEESAAYPIFMKILKYGIEAQPFLYPAYVEQRKIYVKELKQDLKRLLNE